MKSNIVSYMYDSLSDYSGFSAWFINEMLYPAFLIHWNYHGGPVGRNCIQFILIFEKHIFSCMTSLISLKSPYYENRLSSGNNNKPRN